MSSVVLTRERFHVENTTQHRNPGLEMTCSEIYAVLFTCTRHLWECLFRTRECGRCEVRLPKVQSRCRGCLYSCISTVRTPEGLPQGVDDSPG